MPNFDDKEKGKVEDRRRNLPGVPPPVGGPSARSLQDLFGLRPPIEAVPPAPAPYRGQLSRDAGSEDIDPKLETHQERMKRLGPKPGEPGV